MTDTDEFHSDEEELKKAVEDGTMREGFARVHHKLFPKYGFLVPEEPKYLGETIFFGITAHVSASTRFIADLREELRPDQRVQFMAVPQERDGTIKWKGLVVSPLPIGSRSSTSLSSEESNEENKVWLTCKILPNLQPHRGFATPQGGNQYSDNVYFTTREASDGLETQVLDLRLVFKPWEIVRALVVPADSRYKAKYRALKVCKISYGNGSENSKISAESQPLIEEMDKSAVSWIYSVLKLKGSIKISMLVGNLSNQPEVRAVVKPKKRSLKKFLTKYSKFFCVKDNIVMLDPNCPPLQRDPKVEKSWKTYDAENDWSSLSDSEETSSGDESIARESSPSPVRFSPEDLQSVAQVSSKFTLSMLASIIKSLPEPAKMAEIFKICRQRGWSGMVSVAMIAQIVTNNPKYFVQDSKGHVMLTNKGSKLSVENGVESLKVRDKESDQMEKIQAASSGLTDGLVMRKPMTSHTEYDVNFPTTTFPFDNANRSRFSPISNSVLGGSAFQLYESGLLSFPKSSVSTPSATDGDADFGKGGVYHSDPEDSTDMVRKDPSLAVAMNPSEEEDRFLSVTALAIAPKSLTGARDVFEMLKKELDSLGITDSDSDRSSGVLSSHLLCMRLNLGSRPKAIFKHFTPSGKITQTRVSLPAEKIKQKSVESMLKSKFVTHAGKLLHGIDGTYHCIRVLNDELENVTGYTVSFRSKDESDPGVPDTLDFGERKKIKILFTNSNGSNSPSSVCRALKKYALEKTDKLTVTVIDMEGQIFGFGLPMQKVHRIICTSLDSQQRYLKEVVHYHTNVVIVNSIDCEDSLKLLERINAKGIAIYAEVAKSLEKIAKKIFEARS